MTFDVKIVPGTVNFPQTATPGYPLPPASIIVQFNNVGVTFGFSGWIKVVDSANGGQPYIAKMFAPLLEGEQMTINLTSATSYKMPADRDMILTIQVGYQSFAGPFANIVTTDQYSLTVTRGNTQYTCPSPDMYYDPVRGACFPIDNPPPAEGEIPWVYIGAGVAAVGLIFLLRG